MNKNKTRPIIIFDMDGLMIDSELTQSISFKKVLEKHGIKIREKIVQVLGVKVIENLEILKKKYQIKASTKQLFKEKNQIYDRLLKGKITTMPDLFGLIKLLKKAKFRLALASSSNHHHIQLVLKRLNLTNCFEATFSGEQVKKGKPNPEIYLKTAQKLGVRPDCCLVLEDAETGVKAAKNAKMKCIAIPNQYTRSQNFSRADLIVDSLREITIEKILKVMKGA